MYKNHVKHGSKKVFSLTGSSSSSSSSTTQRPGDSEVQGGGGGGGVAPPHLNYLPSQANGASSNNSLFLPPPPPPSSSAAPPSAASSEQVDRDGDQDANEDEDTHEDNEDIFSSEELNVFSLPQAPSIHHLTPEVSSRSPVKVDQYHPVPGPRSSSPPPLPPPPPSVPTIKEANVVSLNFPPSYVAPSAPVIPPFNPSSSPAQETQDHDQGQQVEAAPRLGPTWSAVTSAVSSVLAVIALTFLLLILLTIPGDNSPLLTIHRHLTLSLILAEGALLLGLDGVHSPILCSLTAGLLHFFLLAAFAWTFLEAFDVYLNLVDVYDSVKCSTRLTWYYLLAYGAPALIVSCSLAFDASSYGTSAYCWLRVDNYFCFSFVGPAGGLVLAALLFILISAFLLASSAEDHPSGTGMKMQEEAKREDARIALKWVLGLLVFQTSTWTIGLLHVGLTSWATPAIAFSFLNCACAVYLIFFTTTLSESVQHHKLFQKFPSLGLNCCWPQDECESANSKNSSVVQSSSVYGTTCSTSTLPVVTQMVATQVSMNGSNSSVNLAAVDASPSPLNLSNGGQLSSNPESSVRSHSFTPILSSGTFFSTQFPLLPSSCLLFLSFFPITRPS